MFESCYLLHATGSRLVSSDARRAGEGGIEYEGGTEYLRRRRAAELHGRRTSKPILFGRGFAALCARVGAASPATPSSPHRPGGLEGAAQQLHPRNNHVCVVEAAVLARVGDEAQDITLHRRSCAASRESFVEWCVRSYRTPALTRRARADIGHSASASPQCPVAETNYRLGPERMSRFGLGDEHVSDVATRAGGRRDSRQRSATNCLLCVSAVSAGKRASARRIAGVSLSCCVGIALGDRKRCTQFVHSVHNAFGVPTGELRYGRASRRAQQRMQRAPSGDAKCPDGW